MAERVRVREIGGDEGHRSTRSTGAVGRGRSPCQSGARSRRSPIQAVRARPAVFNRELAKPADFLVAEGVVDDISHEGLRVLLREEGVSLQRVKTWKTSRDLDYAARKARVEHLYAIADGDVIPEDDEPEVIFCMDEFGPLNPSPTRVGNGPNAAAGTRTPTGSPGPWGSGQQLLMVIGGG